MFFSPHNCKRPTMPETEPNQMLTISLALHREDRNLSERSETEATASTLNDGGLSTEPGRRLNGRNVGDLSFFNL
jgi:hypothetical protein